MVDFIRINWGMPFERKRTYPKPGERFGMLTVERVYKSSPRHHYATCQCDCGNTKDVRLDHLWDGRSRSCGCMRDKASGDRQRTHGETGTSLHIMWQAIRNRTRDKGATAWQHYGGRGIRVDPAWDRYEDFRDWALANGYAPGLEIDRIDVNGNYSPDNCRFVTKVENMRNKRDNHRVEAFGEEKTLVEWSEDERCSVAYGTLWARLKRGWSPEHAISGALGVSRA